MQLALFHLVAAHLTAVRIQPFARAGEILAGRARLALIVQRRGVCLTHGRRAGFTAKRLPLDGERAQLGAQTFGLCLKLGLRLFVHVARLTQPCQIAHDLCIFLLAFVACRARMFALVGYIAGIVRGRGMVDGAAHRAGLALAQFARQTCRRMERARGHVFVLGARGGSAGIVQRFQAGLFALMRLFQLGNAAVQFFAARIQFSKRVGIARLTILHIAFELCAAAEFFHIHVCILGCDLLLLGHVFFALFDGGLLIGKCAFACLDLSFYFFKAFKQLLIGGAQSVYLLLPRAQGLQRTQPFLKLLPLLVQCGAAAVCLVNYLIVIFLRILMRTRAFVRKASLRRQVGIQLVQF